MLAHAKPENSTKVTVYKAFVFQVTVKIKKKKKGTRAQEFSACSEKIAVERSHLPK